MTAPFIDLGSTAERVAATAKRLEKAKILGEYFAGLGDEDLTIAARYFAGYVFPLRDQRTTNVGGAALLGAIESVSAIDRELLRQTVVTRGDVGDAAFDLWPNSDAAPRHTLMGVAEYLDSLSKATGTKRRAEILVELLAGTTPLEAKYLVKLLLGDLRIGLREGAVEDSVARLYGISVDSVQWANMLIGDMGETAVLARHGRLDEARMRLFHPLKFMLATAAADVEDVARQMPEKLVVEDKFDGIRAQVHVSRSGGEETLHGMSTSSSRVAIFSRTLDEITGSYPDLLDALGRLAQAGGDGWILDGELLPVSGERILPFQELQKRLGRRKVTQQMLDEVPVAFMAYDCLYGDSRVLLNEPFSERRRLLESLPYDGDRVRLAGSAVFEGVDLLDREFEAARARGNEGLMVKDPGSLYKPGRRGRDWLKVKRALATLDVVVTAVEVGHGRRASVLSDYTFAVRASDTDGKLLNIGKAYSGLTDVEIATLTEWFREHTIKEFAHGRVRLVEPLIVIEVAFDRVQPSKRHTSGFALRFPRIVRIRDDKLPTEIDTLDTVRKIAEEESRRGTDADSVADS